MFSEHTVSIAGRVFTFTDHDLLLVGVSLFIGLLVGAILFFPRKRIALARSNATDQVASELARIAEALERIANRPATRAIAAATRRNQSTASGFPSTIFDR